MAKEKSPAMPFYGREFYDDENVLVMSLEQQGAYIRLLWKCWSEGSIPDDQEKIAAILHVPTSRMGAIWQKLAACFAQTADDRLVNKKIEEIRAKRNVYIEKCSNGGRNSAATRAKVNGKVTSSALEGHLPSTTKSSSTFQFPVSYTNTSPESPSEDREMPQALVGAFECFIERYPNKIGVDMAGQMWLSLVGSGDISDANIAEIEAGLSRWLESKQWTENDGRYVPAPARWLQDKRWKDSPAPSEESRIARRSADRSRMGLDPNVAFIAPWREKETA